MSQHAEPALALRAEHWTRVLTALPSVTGTADEAVFADEFAALLRAGLDLEGSEGCVWQIPVPGSRHPRSAVLALMRGGGPQTVILTGHFDTVNPECYGDLLPFARDPDRLAPALIAALLNEELDVRGRQALADLQSGEFIPGSGLLDMKSGLAAAIAVMEHAARDPGRTGNLLLIAVPDEEANSAGARAVAACLQHLADQLGLQIMASINLDAIADDRDGASGQVVALGSVGKLLPSALVVGQPVHASYSLSGVSAAALAGAIGAAVEWLPSLTPRTGDELGAAPTLLGMQDSKQSYDVTTPESVWLIWNVALHRSGPDEVLRAVRDAIASCADAFRTELTRRRLAIQRSGEEAPQVQVLTFASLFEEAVSKRPGFRTDFEKLARRGRDEDRDLPDISRQLTELTWNASGRSGPAVVIGFASTPYLPVELREDLPARQLESAALQATSAVSARMMTSIGILQFFPGISDMSFLGQADASDIETVLRNSPARLLIDWPKQRAAAGVPTVNAGPWGRDYHTRLERAHRRYTFGVLPALIQDICRRVLSNPDLQSKQQGGPGL